MSLLSIKTARRSLNVYRLPVDGFPAVSNIFVIWPKLSQLMPLDHWGSRISICILMTQISLCLGNPMVPQSHSILSQYWHCQSSHRLITQCWKIPSSPSVSSNVILILNNCKKWEIWSQCVSGHMRLHNIKIWKITRHICLQTPS